ncbi:Methanethiol oxidase [Clydaea vesicula]|uniref:Methanethiol oxidase n=1 Tax=Clydaea vesicula TaxID=447962 RepID=A0AAD5U1Z0_9FUNG|nr:Methanethiol oxidase [Clydaea vesicula]
MTPNPTVPSECCENLGPGYDSPLDAFKYGPREKLLYVPGIRSKGSPYADFLATIDADPDSPEYGTIIHRLPIGEAGQELHHSGWNACSSCRGDATKSRRFLILPAFGTGNIFVVDTASNPKEPKLHKTISAVEIAKKTGLAFPHTPHCLADGTIMISMLGNPKGGAENNGYLLLDENFEVKDRWEATGETTKFGYDFWYQPRQNVMVSSELSSPNDFMKGFDPKDLAKGRYGQHIHVWNWKERRVIESIDLGTEGLVPLELRFLHNPDQKQGFVGTAIGSSMFRFFFDEETTKWKAEKVIQVEPVEVEGWTLPIVPGLITDFVISLDDKYLYLSNWLQGDIRQYDITDTHKPKLVGQLYIGGLIQKGESIKLKDEAQRVEVPLIKGKKLEGGPQMIQLSLDGKRLYITNSLFSTWDNKFYPDMVKNGSALVQVDVDTENGGLKLNENFFVDFGNNPDGAPALAHEVRYPGGDCTSDIWI